MVPDMSHTTNIDTRNPEALTPHPKNDEIYGDEAPDWFVESIKEKGVREPVVVTKESHFEEGKEVIVSGHRRVDAAKEAGLDSIPIRVEEYETAARELEALVDYNQQREKNFSQKMREALELESVERSQAKGRQGTRTDLDQNFGESEWGSTAEKVAEMVGFGNQETYRQARKVWMKKADGYDWAEELVESLNEGEESVYGAYKEVKDREERAKDRERVGWDELGQINHVYTPVDLRHLFDELTDSIEISDWTAVNSLYLRLEEKSDSYDAGYHYTHERESHGVRQAFLYLLEQQEIVALDGEITSPDEPASLVDRKPDSELIENLYVNREMGAGEIAFRFNVHKLVVILWMYEEDIPMRRGDWSEKTQERIDEARGDS